MASSAMSQSGDMTGFTWPSRAGSSPSHGTPLSSSVLVSLPAMTPTVSVNDVPLSSPSAAVSATSGSGTCSSSSTASPTSTGLQRTTHVQVTHTVMVTPTVTAGAKPPPVGASMAEYERGTPFSMSQPLAATADGFSLSTAAPNQEDTAGGSLNLGPTIGGTVAVVGVIMLIFLLYKYCTRSKSKSKSSDVELGQIPSTRSRERQGVARSAPMSHAYCEDPVAVANAMNWQDGEGAQRVGYAARGTGRASGKAATFDICPSALAQAQGWDRPFDADGFQVSRTYGGSTGPSSPVWLPKHIPPRKPVPAARPIGKRRHDTQHISPVSPLTEEEARHYGPYDYSKVSPLDSPTGRPSGWAS
ncbi:hypothetical protein PTNB73_01591 [Pyrenophora teres f. teres]|nr:hypothetical protein HRS9122_01089 [Pyrenophora teres f. teres]KAE8867675.1 hypothetical protein PTNB29_01586 [Pyrenophora teres f. teres]KAE8872440.1 hypothetical protein PTNB73_01591 [Pyrenophora teres f. teres]